MLLRAGHQLEPIQFQHSNSFTEAQSIQAGKQECFQQPAGSRCCGTDWLILSTICASWNFCLANSCWRETTTSVRICLVEDSDKVLPWGRKAVCLCEVKTCAKSFVYQQQTLWTWAPCQLSELVFFSSIVCGREMIQANNPASRVTEIGLFSQKSLSSMCKILITERNSCNLGKIEFLGDEKIEKSWVTVLYGKMLSQICVSVYSDTYADDGGVTP